MERELDTIIGGSPDEAIIERAVQCYSDGLTDFAFPPNQQTELSVLHDGFLHNINEVKPLIASIIQEINNRQHIIESKPYHALQKRDERCWKRNSSLIISGGIIVCVDKGTPSETLGLTQVSAGRTFAGDSQISYSPSSTSFTMLESPIGKRFIHIKRLGGSIPEKLIEHTNCGRRGQILANEEGHPDIPTTSSIMDHLEALRDEFIYTSDDEKNKGIKTIKTIWDSLERHGVSVKAPDGGVWVGIIGKIAQRQALRHLLGSSVYPTVELYNKATGDLIAGLDKLEIVTDPLVVKEKGFTENVILSLIQDEKIFSLTQLFDKIAPLLFSQTQISKGSKTYENLQEKWLDAQTDLVTLTEALWHLYEKNDPHVTTMVKSYFNHAFATTSKEYRPNGDIERWFIHQLFHTFSYAYLFNTLEIGHSPGIQHKEDHLAIGDHDIGTKVHLALGQGDLENPSSSEIFTGYSVLLHSKPGKEHKPIVVMIKLDTDRTDDQPLSTEETKIALDSFKEFLDLWPYLLVGDMIPVVTIRGKQQHGISRLALSIVLTFMNINTLIDREKNPLPSFVYATNSKGEVVYIPAQTVLDVGKETTCDIQRFREELPKRADEFSSPEIQEAFINAVQKS